MAKKDAETNATGAVENEGDTISVEVNPAKNASPQTAYTVKWQDEAGKTQVRTIERTDVDLQRTGPPKKEGEVGEVETYRGKPVTVPANHPAVRELLRNELIREARR